MATKAASSQLEALLKEQEPTLLLSCADSPAMVPSPRLRCFGERPSASGEAAAAECQGQGRQEEGDLPHSQLGAILAGPQQQLCWHLLSGRCSALSQLHPPQAPRAAICATVRCQSHAEQPLGRCHTRRWVPA